MLKIKENVDLKELERFGFEYHRNDNLYSKEIYESDCRLVVDPDRIICYDNNSTADMSYHNVELLTELYNLIQAGLVEKVVEE